MPLGVGLGHVAAQGGDTVAQQACGNLALLAEAGGLLVHFIQQQLAMQAQRFRQAARLARPTDVAELLAIGDAAR